MSLAKIRYFCLIMPGPGPLLGFDYLEALHETGLGVRACPIGAAVFLMDAPWNKINHLFMGGAVEDTSFINVVCSPPNLLMGAAMKASDVKPPKGVGAPTGDIRSDETIYKPQTALSGLFTVGAGIKNIAITIPKPKPPDEHEIRALQLYDAVLTPNLADAMTFEGLGISARHMLPDAKRLKELIDSMLPVVVSG